MTAPKCHAGDDIDFLIASPKAFCCTEAARVQPLSLDPPAHDAFTRLLHRLEPDPETLWRESRRLVDVRSGVLVLDDSTLDKPYARKMDLVARHWSGKHKRVVNGINLVTLLWTDGDKSVPCDYRIYDKANDGLTKNDHFRAMLAAARERGFTPECVLFDGWYASLDNLKTLRECGWCWLTRLKANRKVNLNRQGLRAMGETPIEAGGTVVHLEGYGLIRVFKIVSRDGRRVDRGRDRLPQAGDQERRCGADVLGHSRPHRELSDRRVLRLPLRQGPDARRLRALSPQGLDR